MNGKIEATVAINTLRKFIGKSQLQCIGDACRGEEMQFFFDKLVELAAIVNTMPKTYEQDGAGMDAIAHLHYFNASMDWYITERDIETVQHQAFGLADIGYGGELGYISIEELIGSNVELDMYFKPTSLANLKRAIGV